LSPPAIRLLRSVFLLPRALRRAVLLLALALASVLAPRLALAASDGVELAQLSTHKTDDGLELSFSTRFELTRPVEEALMNGVKFYFIAEVNVLRHRWYWRDVRVNRSTRTWRLSWESLYRQYKVSTGGLNQSFSSLPEALASLRAAAGWRIADAKDLDGDGGYYLEFSYRLDTAQLPRPMQIVLGPNQGFNLSTERTIGLAPDLSAQTITP